MNIIEQLRNTDSENQGKPDEVIAEALLSKVEDINKEHCMKLDPMSEVNSYYALKERFAA